MRLALDEQIFAIQAYGGISRLFAELTRQFTQRKIFDIEMLPMSAPIVNRYVLDDPLLTAALGARQARNEWTALARYASRLHTHPQADLVHNTFYLPHGLTPTRGAKRIVTVYDMIPELMPNTRRRLDLLTMKRRYVDIADHIICISHATKNDLLRVYPEVSAPISVIHLAVDPAFAPDQPALPDLPDEYILMVGHRGQYKDADVLFRAFARIAHHFLGVDLVCIGGGVFSKDEWSLLTELGITQRVHQDVLSEPRLPAAYANALAFVFPSRFEGFGFPVLEAMSSGAPTILADSTSLPEVGADAARYFSVGDDDGLARVLTEVLSDERVRQELRERGLRRSRDFTWEKTAQKTADVYRSALDS